jgi:glycine hydroxymethyltransferase
MHIIAAKAVSFQEALQPAFKTYQRQILNNAQALSEALVQRGYDLVSGGTDNHLMLVDLSSIGVTGIEAEQALGEAGIVVNKNTIPFDQRGPKVTSGIRIGTPALTTRGMKEPEMTHIAELIDWVLRDLNSEATRLRVKNAVLELCDRFPIYEFLNEGRGL